MREVCKNYWLSGVWTTSGNLIPKSSLVIDNQEVKLVILLRSLNIPQIKGISNHQANMYSAETNVCHYIKTRHQKVLATNILKNHNLTLVKR